MAWSRSPSVPARAVHERLGILTQAWSLLGKRNAPFSADPVAISGLAREDGRLFGGDPGTHEEM